MKVHLNQKNSLTSTVDFGTTSIMLPSPIMLFTRRLLSICVPKLTGTKHQTRKAIDSKSRDRTEGLTTTNLPRQSKSRSTPGKWDQNTRKWHHPVTCQHCTASFYLERSRRDCQYVLETKLVVFVRHSSKAPRTSTRSSLKDSRPLETCWQSGE